MYDALSDGSAHRRVPRRTCLVNNTNSARPLSSKWRSLTMPYVYSCPVDGCEFSMEDSQRDFVVEHAQEHQREEHGEELDQGEIDDAISGSGQP